MPWAVIGIGVLAQEIVCRLVARDRLHFWPAVTTTFAVLGIGSLLAGDPGCCRETTPATASVVTGLATWSGGVAAPVATHLVWTELMLVWPPRAARDKVPS